MSNDTNDTVNVQRGIVGSAAGDDTYVLSASLIDDNADITISDVEGANKIQLIGGLSITSSIVAGDTAQLTLSNGAVVTVLGASTMSYEVGGNPLTGTAGVTKDYSTFVADVLGTTVPTEGTSTGGTSTVNEDGTATGGTPTGSYTLTAAAASVDEGATATFNLTSTDVAEGTVVNYTITGVDAADVDGGSLTGTATVAADGSATITVALTADVATEGSETLTVTLDGTSVSASSTVNDTSVTSTFAELEAAYEAAKAAAETASQDTSTVELATAYQTAAQAAVDAAASMTTAATTAEETATALTATNDSAVVLELAKTAVYDETLADYNEAVTVAAASKAAADTAALTVSTVELANASLTAANTAKADADAQVTLATALVAAAANTPSIADDAVAATANTDSATAQASAATLVTVATTAVTDAQAAEDAAAAVGESFVLTTNTETVFGTSKSDTITGTAGNSASTKTFNANDTIVDSSSLDNDTLTITADDDITATATVVGIENVNLNLDAASTPAGTDTVFDVNAANISSGTITLDVTKSATTVTAASITNVKDDVTVATDLSSFTVGGVADADLTVNLTKTSGSVTLADVTGTIDDLTINSSTTGTTTITDANAEENIVVNTEGALTITNMTPATTSKTTLDANAKGAITVTNYTSGGDVDLSTTTGDVTVSMAAHTNNSTDDLTVNTDAGNITITNGGAGTGTQTLTATGDITNASTADDGDITVTANNNTLNSVITATGGVTVTSMTGVKTLEVNFGQASTLANNTAAVTALKLSSTNASASAADRTLTVTTGGTGLNNVDTITFEGSNDITLAVDGTDLVAAAASTAGGTTATKVIATDNSTATSRIEIQEAPGGSLDLSGLAVDQIATTVDAGANTLTVASGANFYVAADQTNLTLTAAAVAGNTVNIFVEDDSSATDTNSWDMTALTSTNISTVNLYLNDTEEATLATTTNVGTANTLKVHGAGDLTIGTSITAAKLDGSSATGKFNIQLVNTIDTVIVGGSGDDTFTTDGTANDYNIDGGAGVDTFVVANGETYASTALSLTNIEKIDITAANGDATFAGSLVTGKDYVVFGNAAADVFDVDVQVATGETVDMSGVVGSLSTLTMTGLAGGDSLTGSAVTATTFTGAAGSDTIIGGAGGDTINVLFEVGAADSITTGGGVDTISTATTTAATISTVVITDFDLGTATTSKDILNVSDTALTGLTTSTDFVDTSANSVANTDGTVVALGSDGATVANADLVVINTQTYASEAEMLAGLKTAGASTITYGSALTDNDSYLIAYSDGTDAYVAVATTGTGSLTTSEGVDSVANIFKLEGVSLSGLANLDSTDFAYIT